MVASIDIVEKNNLVSFQATNFSLSSWDRVQTSLRGLVTDYAVPAYSPFPHILNVTNISLLHRFFMADARANT